MIPQAYPLFLVIHEAWDHGDGPEFDIHGPHRVIGWRPIGNEYIPIRIGLNGHGASDVYEEGVSYERHYFDTYDAATAGERNIVEDALKWQAMRRARAQEIVDAKVAAGELERLPGGLVRETKP